MVKVIFKSKKREVNIPAGCDFLEMHHKFPDLPIKFGCKRGECGTCAIKILHGKENLTKISTSERATLIKKGYNESYRLACQCALNGPINIE